MFKLLLTDLKAKQALYAAGGPAPSMLRMLVSDGTIANTLYRLQHFLNRTPLSPLALVPHLVNKWINGCVIGVKADFGPGFVLVHPVGVVINSCVKGGSNVWLESGVVIGENRGGFPSLGSDVFVGSGAKIIGALHVGDRARVGANAVVTKDVPADHTALGIPAKNVPPKA